MVTRQYSDKELLALHERRERTFSVTLTSQQQHAILFEPYNISHTEYRVLAQLFFGGGCEPSVIADRLMILRQTMTKVVVSLEAKGYAERTVHSYDRRKVYIQLLPEGKRLARELLCLESDYLERVDRHFTREEMETYRALTRRIQDTRFAVMQEILDERNAEKEKALDA